MGSDRAEYPGRIGITRTYDRNRGTLSDLTDVNVGGVDDGDLLQYDTTTNTWITISVVELADQINLVDLGDTTFTSLTTGDILFWDGDDWVNGTLGLDDLDDVVLASPAAGDILYFDGANWVDMSLEDALEDLGGFNNPTPVQTVGEPNGIRLIRGHVADDGTLLHGGGFTSSNTAVGRYSISFSYAFPEVPALAVTAEYGSGNRMRCVSWTSLATGGFSIAIQEDVSGTWTDTDANFSFVVIGMAGNY